MPTKRTRVIHPRKNLSNTQLFYASDGLWGDEADVNKFEGFTYKSPTVCPDECREVWLTIRDELLPQWTNEHPGTRPTWWYLFDPECPRISAEDISRHGWTGCYFKKDIPDLRRRIGGIGDPSYLHYSLVPHFDCAIPDQFVTVADVEWHREEGEEFKGVPFDPTNPPTYESQASYLDRHGLLTAAERRRLRKKDFKPEVLTVSAGKSKNRGEKQNGL
jgi:hypothetical protein